MMTDTHAEPHPTRTLKTFEAPLDPANQSLADALRTSFRILKLAMIVLVILFFATGAFVVEQNEQAIVLRLGRTVGGVRDAGVYWAFPYPIDEVLKLPVKASSTLAIDSHWLHLSDNEKGLSLDQIRRGDRGLHPVRDGALLTGDRGLVHVKWQLTYRISDLMKFVEVVADADFEMAEAVITKILEHAAIEVAGGFTTEDATRKRLTDLRDQVKVLVNIKLEELQTGIVVESVEIPESTPPLQTRLAFVEVARAENQKQTAIRTAEQMRNEILNQTAGAAHERLINLIDEMEEAQDSGDHRRVETLAADIGRIVEFEASGEVGRMIRQANSYYTYVVQSMRGDAEQYEVLLAEYRSQPELLMSRLWQETKQRLLSMPDVTKVYRPGGTLFRLRIGLDPRQREREETQEYQQELENLGKGHQHIRELTPGGKVG